MTRSAHRGAHGRPLPDGPAPFTTLVELTFDKRKVEHWTFAMSRPSRAASSIGRCACAVSPSWRRWGWRPSTRRAFGS